MVDSVGPSDLFILGCHNPRGVVRCCALRIRNALEFHRNSRKCFFQETRLPPPRLQSSGPVALVDSIPTVAFKGPMARQNVAQSEAGLDARQTGWRAGYPSTINKRSEGPTESTYP